MSLLTAFHNVLQQFLDDLIYIFPELSDLKTMQTLVQLMRSANPRMVQYNFLEVAGRYHENIFKCEEAFFYNLDNWKDDPYFDKHKEQTGDDMLFQRLVVFKDEWKSLTSTNKNKIWTYLQQLLVLSAKANTHDQLQPISNAVLECAIKNR